MKLFETLDLGLFLGEFEVVLLTSPIPLFFA